MPTYHDIRLKPCRTCGVRPVLEAWSSCGMCYAVRCDNPDRPDSCDDAFTYSLNRNPEEAIRRWNEYQTMETLPSSVRELDEIKPRYKAGEVTLKEAVRYMRQRVFTGNDALAAKLLNEED